MYNKLKELILTANLVDEVLAEDEDPSSKMRVVVKAVINGIDLANFSTEKVAEVGKNIDMLKAKYLDSSGDFFVDLIRPAVGNAIKVFYKKKMNDLQLVKFLVERLVKIFKDIRNLSDIELKDQVEKLQNERNVFTSRSPLVFIGHGRNQVWVRLERFIREELKIPVFAFESETRANETIVDILKSFLNKATFAILVFAGDDHTSDGYLRARQNVVHEAGLFQGRLGFDKVVVLKQKNVENLSNLDGLQYIGFEEGRIEDTFKELRGVFKKHGLLNDEAK
jgi:predicted nucleotide-binding protein